VALAYLSDGPLLFNSVLPHGAPFQTHRVTSLDHAAWFHRDVDPTEWLLFDQRSTAAAGGRGMNHGEIFTAEGLLGVSVAQESMLRRMS
jgi:acyl-CoA thioesterase-2